MPRIRLAYWHDGHAPGDEIDVTVEEAAALSRDGRVAEILPAPSAPSQSVEAEQPARKRR